MDEDDDDTSNVDEQPPDVAMNEHGEESHQQDASKDEGSTELS